MKQSILANAALAALAACAENALAGNVALGKPVVVGSYYNGYLPENVVDGNFNTFWNGGTWGSPGSSCWVKIDLQAEFHLQRVILWKPNGSDVYELYGSVDDITWTLLLGPVASTVEGSLPVETRGQPFRYLRCDVVGGADWSSVAELEAFPAVEISNIAVASGAVRLSLANCLPDVSYTVERTFDLANPAGWTPLATLSGIVDGTVWEGAVSTESPQAFYRIRSP